MKSLLTKAAVAVLAVSMTIPALSWVAFAQPEAEPVETIAAAPAATNEDAAESTPAEVKAFNPKVLSDNDYEKYLSAHADAGKPDTVIRLEGADAVRFDAETGAPGEKLPFVKDVASENKPDEKYSGALFFDEGFCGWTFTAPQAGLYNVRLHYFAYDEITYEEGGQQITIESKSSAIQRKMYLDYEVPFYETRQINFERAWKDSGLMTVDSQTLNEKRPYQEETGQWLSAEVRDYMGYKQDPFQFYLSAGEHTLVFEAIKEGMLVDYVEFYQEKEAPTYAELLKEYESKGYQKVTDEAAIFIQAEGLHDPQVYNDKQRAQFLTQEDSDRYTNYIPAGSVGYDATTDVTYRIIKSSPTLYAITDRSSPVTVPYHSSKIRYNTIGADKWQSPNQWIQWNVTVKKAGLYAITLKARQNTLNGMYTTRKLTINGVMPCREVAALRFQYGNSFDNYTLGDEENGTYYFYFEEGENTVRMETTLGNLGGLLAEAESSLTQLNAAYRQILMITGSTPDVNNDYQLSVFVPGALEIIRQEYDNLTALEEKFIAEFGKSANAQLSSLKNMTLILEEINDDSTNAASLFSNFKDAIASVGTWINDMSETPLELDYLVISPAEKVEELPAPGAGFFASVLHELRSFIASFTEDYDNIGGTVATDGKEPVEVWLETGAGLTGSRDNATILKQLIDDMFTAETGIVVETRLVAGGSLLPSVLAGIGPQICLSRDATSAINYAFRGAVMNLADEALFPDYKEVLLNEERFAHSAIEPFTFGNNIYGIPETQDFYMLFYRTDILEELGLEPPETWSDVYSMIQDLQNKQMEFAMPVPVVGSVGSGNMSYAMLLYQKGGRYYNDVRSATELTTDEGLDAFKEWTEFYTLYNLPNTYDFANRFRTGEVPVGIASYSAYSTLAVFAPEIQGLWEFALVPGTERTDADGNTYIDHSCASSTSAAVMLSMDTTTDEGKESARRAWEFLKWWTGDDAQYRFGTEIESLLGAAARYQTANLKAMAKLPWDAKSMKTIQEQWEHAKCVPQAPGAYYTARNIEFAWKEVINNNSDPNTTFYEYVSKINKEIARKTDEFHDKIVMMTQKKGEE